MTIRWTVFGYDCPLCGTWVPCDHVHICNTAATRTDVASLGWECPRCRTIHAPWVSRCDCPAPTVVSSSIQVTIPQEPSA